jgi:hypothetical protein
LWIDNFRFSRLVPLGFSEGQEVMIDLEDALEIDLGTEEDFTVAEEAGQGLDPGVEDVDLTEETEEVIRGIACHHNLHRLLSINSSPHHPPCTTTLTMPHILAICNKDHSPMNTELLIRRQPLNLFRNHQQLPT